MSNEYYPYASQPPAAREPLAPSTAARVSPTNVFATPAPPSTPEGPSRGRARVIVALVITLFIGECMAIFLWVGTTTYGFTRILSLALAYSVAFRIMFACLAAIIWQRSSGSCPAFGGPVGQDRHPAVASGPQPSRYRSSSSFRAHTLLWPTERPSSLTS